MKVIEFAAAVLSVAFFQEQAAAFNVAKKCSAIISDVTSSRREALIKGATAFLGVTVSTVSSFPYGAVAKPAYPEVEADKKKIVDGFKGLEYLLANWEKETTVCGRYDNPYIGDGKGCGKQENGYELSGWHNTSSYSMWRLLTS